MRGCAACEAKVHLEAATEGGSCGFSVGFTFSFEFCETCVSRIAAYFRERGMLKVVLSAIDLRTGHCPVDDLWSVRQLSKLCC